MKKEQQLTATQLACNMKCVHVTAAEKFYQFVWNKVIIHLEDFDGMIELIGIIGKLVSASGFEDVSIRLIYVPVVASMEFYQGSITIAHVQ